MNVIKKYDQKKFCTVVTDASWCPNQNVAGWAVWLVCNGERHKQYGAFKGIIRKPHEAEMKAIINGIYIASKIFEPQHYHVVTDCTGAIHKLSFDADWKKVMNKILESNSITFAHVKAHSSNKDKRSYVNSWCYKHAKEAMISRRVLVREC